MNVWKLIALIFVMAAIIVSTGSGVSAQDEVDAVALVEQFLPEGITVETATKDDLIAAVKQALAANPDKAADIVKQVGAHRPDALDDIVNAALDVAPEEISAIHQAAQRLRLQGLPVTKPSREEPSPVRP